MPLKEIILESKERSQAPDIFKLDNLELLTESANHGILVFLLVWTSEMDQYRLWKCFLVIIAGALCRIMLFEWFLMVSAAPAPRCQPP